MSKKSKSYEKSAADRKADKGKKEGSAADRREDRKGIKAAGKKRGK